MIIAAVSHFLRSEPENALWYFTEHIIFISFIITNAGADSRRLKKGDDCGPALVLSSTICTQKHLKLSTFYKHRLLD